MISNEPALGAVLTLARFDLAQTAAEVAQAASLSELTQQQESVAAKRCEAAARELRSAVLKLLINPALHQAMHCLYRAEQHTLHDCQARLAKAKEREERARTALGRVRNQERSLERALQAERRRHEQKRQARDLIQADDIWLQQMWREAP